MIGESQTYKQYLLRLAAKTNRWHRENHWSESRLDAFERDIFHAFYTIRRLAECHKLSAHVAKKAVPLRMFKPTGEKVSFMSRDDTWELYDLNHPERTTRPLLFICNQVMHSFVFQLWMDPSRKTSSFIFSSDRERRRAAYRMTRGTYVSLLRTVGRNYPAMAQLEFDQKTQDYVIRMK